MWLWKEESFSLPKMLQELGNKKKENKSVTSVSRREKCHFYKQKEKWDFFFNDLFFVIATVMIPHWDQTRIWIS